MKKLFLVAVASSFMLTSCVSKKKFADLEDTHGATQNQLTDTKANLEKCLLSKDQNDAKVQDLEERIDFLKKNNTNMLDRLGDLSILSKNESDNVKNSLAKINKQDKYISGLQNAIARKDSLNMQLVLNLKGALANVNDDDIEINVEKGVVFISISDKLLFRSGSYRVSKNAESVLGKVAKVVNAKPEIEIMVEGYTDSKSIHTAALEDNWDLSVKRATSVVRILQNKYKVNPERLIAAGRSEYHPVSDNKTVQGRAKNRRTKIVILPKLDQFFELLEKKN